MKLPQNRIVLIVCERRVIGGQDVADIESAIGSGCNPKLAGRSGCRLSARKAIHRSESASARLALAFVEPRPTVGEPLFHAGYKTIERSPITSEYQVLANLHWVAPHASLERV